MFKVWVQSKVVSATLHARVSVFAVVAITFLKALRHKHPIEQSNACLGHGKGRGGLRLATALVASFPHESLASSHPSLVDRQTYPAQGGADDRHGALHASSSVEGVFRLPILRLTIPNRGDYAGLRHRRASQEVFFCKSDVWLDSVVFAAPWYFRKKNGQKGCSKGARTLRGHSLFTVLRGGLYFPDRIHIP